MDRRRPAHAKMPRASVHTTGDDPRVGARQRRDRRSLRARAPSAFATDATRNSDRHVVEIWGVGD